MTLVDFIRLSRANLWRIILSVLLGAALAYGYAATLPKVYAADASGFVSTSGGAQSTGEVIAGSSLAGTKADAYLPLVYSRAVATKVVQKLGLSASPSEVAGRVSASVDPGSTIMRVNATGPTPEEARDVADATVQATADEANRLELGGEVRPNQTALVKILPIESALLPGSPIGPNMKKYALVGGAAGLGLIYLWILGRRLLDTRLRTVREVEELSGSTSLGIIPVAPELRVKKGRGKIGKLGIAAEGFRQLRTNLRFVSVDSPPRSIVVTSANPSEGKSTVSATLARVLGEAGQPTIIIDADLRRPTLSSIFDVDGTIGLSQVLSGQVAVQDALVDTDQVNLRIIPAGRIPPNPSELLGSQRMRSLIEELAVDHLVIMDAPPLLPVTDAGLLSGVSDGTLLVFAVGKTHKEQVQFCSKILGQVGGTVLGVVLNMAPKKAMGDIAYGGGYGGYGYSGYGYSYDYSNKEGGGRRRAPTRRERRKQAKESAQEAKAEKANA